MGTRSRGAQSTVGAGGDRDIQFEPPISLARLGSERRTTMRFIGRGKGRGSEESGGEAAGAEVEANVPVSDDAGAGDGSGDEEVVTVEGRKGRRFRLPPLPALPVLGKKKGEDVVEITDLSAGDSADDARAKRREEWEKEKRRRHLRSVIDGVPEEPMEPFDESEGAGAASESAGAPGMSPESAAGPYLPVGSASPYVGPAAGSPVMVAPPTAPISSGPDMPAPPAGPAAHERGTAQMAEMFAAQAYGLRTHQATMASPAGLVQAEGASMLPPGAAPPQGQSQGVGAPMFPPGVAPPGAAAPPANAPASISSSSVAPIGWGGVFSDTAVQPVFPAPQRNAPAPAVRPPMYSIDPLLADKIRRGRQLEGLAIDQDEQGNFGAAQAAYLKALSLIVPAIKELEFGTDAGKVERMEEKKVLSRQAELMLTRCENIKQFMAATGPSVPTEMPTMPTARNVGTAAHRRAGSYVTSEEDDDSDDTGEDGWQPINRPAPPPPPNSQPTSEDELLIQRMTSRGDLMQAKPNLPPRHVVPTARHEHSPEPSEIAAPPCFMCDAPSTVMTPCDHSFCTSCGNQAVMVFGACPVPNCDKPIASTTFRNIS